MCPFCMKRCQPGGTERLSCGNAGAQAATSSLPCSEQGYPKFQCKGLRVEKQGVPEGRLLKNGGSFWQRRDQCLSGTRHRFASQGCVVLPVPQTRRSQLKGILQPEPNMPEASKPAEQTARLEVRAEGNRAARWTRHTRATCHLYQQRSDQHRAPPHGPGTHPLGNECKPEVQARL